MGPIQSLWQWLTGSQVGTFGLLLLVVIVLVQSWGFLRKRFALTGVTVNLPFNLGQAEWTPNHAARAFAWGLLIELRSRIATQHLSAESGLLREAFDSLHSLYESTRSALDEAGPAIAVEPDGVGWLALEVLNRGLRQFLSKWHPELSHWEEQRGQGVSRVEHERAWPENAACRRSLEDLRQELVIYAEALRRIVTPTASPTALGRAANWLRARTLGYDFFISYSRQDALAYATELERQLNSTV